MKIDILTIFPNAVDSFLGESILGRARKSDKIHIQCHDIRHFSVSKHKNVDDYPYGGSEGMLLMAEPIYRCYKSVIKGLEYKPLTIYMSPKGTVLTQQLAVEFSIKHQHIILICGHYEGVDQRLIDKIVDLEVSIGDYVITGGEIAAIVFTDCICRLIDGVLKSEQSYKNESHYNSLLEFDSYTRPSEWQGLKVPDVLISGHHKNIEKFNRESSLKNTFINRPDLLQKANLSNDDLDYIDFLKSQLDK